MQTGVGGPHSAAQLPITSRVPGRSDWPTSSQFLLFCKCHVRCGLHGEVAPRPQGSGSAVETASLEGEDEVVGGQELTGGEDHVTE